MLVCCVCVIVFVCCRKSVGVQFEAHSVVTCAALYKAFTFCKQEMNRYLAQLEKGQVSACVRTSVGRLVGQANY